MENRANSFKISAIGFQELLLGCAKMEKIHRKSAQKRLTVIKVGHCFAFNFKAGIIPRSYYMWGGSGQRSTPSVYAKRMTAQKLRLLYASINNSLQLACIRQFVLGG